MNILYDGKVVGKIIDSKIVDATDKDLQDIARQIKSTGGVTLMVPSDKSSDEKIVDGAEFVAVDSDDFPAALSFYLFERGFDMAAIKQPVKGVLKMVAQLNPSNPY